MKLKIIFPVLILSLRFDTAFSAAISDEKIFGGHLVSITEVPYSAQVIATKCNGRKCFTYSCGGSILRRNLILTAGHCVLDNKNRLYSPGSFSIFVGSNQYASGVEHKVSKVYIHPKYVNAPPRHHDVAILQLAKNINLNARAKLVNLARKNDKTALGTKCSISGWGKNPDHPNEKRIYRVFLNVVPSSQCARAFGDPQFDKHEICANAPKKSSCQGDSGSAFIDTKTNRQIGLVSYGSLDCTSRLPSAYCKVTDNLDFINNVISRASKSSPSHCQSKQLFSKS